uniref:Uncharacterized protein n=1 Tax=Heterorhabditis bacteriophora TaxID=37862 RepID=A0A1I7XBZ0_HETBA
MLSSSKFALKDVIRNHVCSAIFQYDPVARLVDSRPLIDQTTNLVRINHHALQTSLSSYFSS